MYKFILCLLFTSILHTAHSAEMKEFPLDISEQVWTVPIQEPSIILSALRKIPKNHILVAVHTEYFTFNDYAWNPLIAEALLHDILIDEDAESTADSNGFKQTRDGVFLLSNTDKAQDFIEEWVKQTQAQVEPEEGHPTLFSYLLSDFRKKDGEFRVSNLIWPLPLTWGKDPDPSACLIPTILQCLKKTYEEKEEDIVFVDAEED